MGKAKDAGKHTSMKQHIMQKVKEKGKCRPMKTKQHVMGKANDTVKHRPKNAKQHIMRKAKSSGKHTNKNQHAMPKAMDAGKRRPTKQRVVEKAKDTGKRTSMQQHVMQKVKGTGKRTSVKKRLVIRMFMAGQLLSRRRHALTAQLKLKEQDTRMHSAVGKQCGGIAGRSYSPDVKPCQIHLERLDRIDSKFSNETPNSIANVVKHWKWNKASKEKCSPPNISSRLQTLSNHIKPCHIRLDRVV